MESEAAEGGVLLGGEDQLARAAVKMGVLCSACEQPIEEVAEPVEVVTPASETPVKEIQLTAWEPPAYEYLRLVPEVRDGVAGVSVLRDVVCTRDSCAEERAELEREAHFRRSFRAWEWLPDGPLSPEEAP